MADPCRDGRAKPAVPGGDISGPYPDLPELRPTDILISRTASESKSRQSGDQTDPVRR